MTRDQMLAILDGARLALPHVTDQRAVTLWREAVAKVDSDLRQGGPASTSATLAWRQIEIEERFGRGAAASERTRLAARVLLHAFRAISDEAWEHAARSEGYLRRLSPDLTYEITVPTGKPPEPVTFSGRWLVAPDPSAAELDDGAPAGEDGPTAYRGIAVTAGERIVVYTGYLDENWPARLDEYPDLNAAATRTPADDVRRAGAAVVREFNRQAWLRPYRTGT
jgi:hypothetical protein